MHEPSGSLIVLRLHPLQLSDSLHVRTKMSNWTISQNGCSRTKSQSSYLVKGRKRPVSEAG